MIGQLILRVTSTNSTAKIESSFPTLLILSTLMKSTLKNCLSNFKRNRRKFPRRKLSAFFIAMIKFRDFSNQKRINNFIMSIQAINILDKKGNVIIN